MQKHAVPTFVDPSSTRKSYQFELIDSQNEYSSDVTDASITRCLVLQGGPRGSRRACQVAAVDRAIVGGEFAARSAHAWLQGWLSSPPALHGIGTAFRTDLPRHRHRLIEWTFLIFKSKSHKRVIYPSCSARPSVRSLPASQPGGGDDRLPVATFAAEELLMAIDWLFPATSRASGRDVRLE